MVMHGKKLYGTATIGSKGQIVIPSEARDELDLKTGDKLYIAGSPSKKVLFCLKEDQLQQFIEHITADMENAKSLLETFKKADQ